MPMQAETILSQRSTEALWSSHRSLEVGLMEEVETEEMPAPPLPGY